MSKDIKIAERLAKLNLKVGDRVKVSRAYNEEVIGIVVGCKENGNYPMTYVPQPDRSPPMFKDTADIGTGYEERYTKEKAVYEFTILGKVSSEQAKRDASIESRLAKEGLKLGDRVKSIGKTLADCQGIVVGHNGSHIIVSYQSDTKVDQGKIAPFMSESDFQGVASEYAYLATIPNHKACRNKREHLLTEKDIALNEKLAAHKLQLGDKVKLASFSGGYDKKLSEYVGTVIGWSANFPVLYFAEEFNGYAKIPEMFGSQYQQLSETSEKHCLEVYPKNIMKLSAKDIAFNEVLAKHNLKLGDKVKIDQPVYVSEHRKLTEYVGTVVGLRENRDPIIHFEEDISGCTTYQKPVENLGSQYEHLSETSRQHCLQFFVREVKKITEADSNDARIIAALADLGLTLGEQVKTFCPGIGIVVGYDTSIRAPLVAYQEDKSEHINQTFKKDKAGFASQYLHLFETQGKYIRAVSTFKLSPDEKNDFAIETELAEYGFKLTDKVRHKNDEGISELIGTVVGIRNGILYVQYDEDISRHITSSKNIEGYASAFKQHHKDSSKHTYGSTATSFTKMTPEHLNTVMFKLDNQIASDLAAIGYVLGEKVKFDNGTEKAEATIVGIRANKRTPILLTEQDVKCANIFFGEEKECIASSYLSSVQEHSKRAVASAPEFLMTQAEEAIAENLAKLGFAPNERVLAQENGKTYTGTVIGVREGKFPVVLLDASATEFPKELSIGNILARHRQALKANPEWQSNSFMPTSLHSEKKLTKAIEARLAKHNWNLGDRCYTGNNEAATVIGALEGGEIVIRLNKEEGGYAFNQGQKLGIHRSYAHQRENKHLIYREAGLLHKSPPDEAIINALAKLHLKPGDRVCIIENSKNYLATVVGYDSELKHPVIEFDNSDDLIPAYGQASTANLAQPHRSRAMLHKLAAYPNDSIKIVSATDEEAYRDRLIAKTFEKLNFKLGQRIVLSKNGTVPSWTNWNDTATEYAYGTVIGFYQEYDKTIKPIILSDEANGGIWAYTKAIGKQHIVHSSYRALAEKQNRCIHVHPDAIQDAAAFDQKRLAEAAKTLAKQMTEKNPVKEAGNIILESQEQDQEIVNQLQEFKLRVGDKVELGVNSYGAIEYATWKSENTDRITGTVIGVLNKMPVVELDKAHSKAETNGWNNTGLLFKKAKFHSKHSPSPEQRFLFIEKNGFRPLPKYDVKIGEELHHSLFGVGVVIGMTASKNPIVRWEKAEYNSSSLITTGGASADHISAEYEKHQSGYIAGDNIIDECRAYVKKIATIKAEEVKKELVAKVAKRIEIKKAEASKDIEIEKQLATLGVRIGEQVEVSCAHGYIDYHQWNPEATKVIGTIVGTLEGKLLIELPEINPSKDKGWGIENESFQRMKLHSKHQEVNKRLWMLGDKNFRPIPKYDVKIGDRIEAMDFGTGTVIGVSAARYPIIAWDNSSHNTSSRYSTDYIAEEYKDHKGFCLPDEVQAKTFIKLPKATVAPVAPIKDQKTDEQLIREQLTKHGLTVGDKVQLVVKYGRIQWGAADYDVAATDLIQGTVVGIWGTDPLIQFDEGHKVSNSGWGEANTHLFSGAKIADYYRGTAISRLLHVSPRSFQKVSANKAIKETWQKALADNKAPFIGVDVAAIATASLTSLALPKDRSSLKHHFHEAGYRVAVHQLTNLSKAGLVKLLRSKGMENTHIQNFTDFLDTDLGKSLFSLIVGMGLSQVKQGDQRVQKLAAEFRIGGMTTAGNLAIDTLLEYLKPALLEMMSQKPEPQLRIAEQSSPLAEALEEAALEEEEERQFKY